MFTTKTLSYQLHTTTSIWNDDKQSAGHKLLQLWWNTQSFMRFKQTSICEDELDPKNIKFTVENISNINCNVKHINIRTIERQGRLP